VLTRGLDALPQGNASIREEIDARARREGWPALHAELARVDAAAARRIAPNDAQRIQRALEVWRVAGRPLSSLHGAARPALPFELVGFALVPERAELHRRIAGRFQKMLRDGLVEELRELRTRYRLDASMPSMRTVGYRQAWEHLEGRLDASRLEETAVAATRQLAKRQLTWLRSFPEVETIAPDAGALARRLPHSFL
jgi:tRNA dimethylallyltransferase